MYLISLGGFLNAAVYKTINKVARLLLEGLKFNKVIYILKEIERGLLNGNAWH